MMVESLMLKVTPEGIGDDTLLFAPEGLGLDSIDALALAVVILAAALSYRNWRRTRTESRGDVHELAEIGEGRTRFMSLWGMLFGLAFGAAIIFGVVVNIGLRAC